MNRREKLFKEKRQLEIKVSKLSNQIKTIDNKANQKEINKMIGKCFRTNYGWVLISGFDFKRNCYEGHEITQFGQGKNRILEFRTNSFHLTKDGRHKIIPKSIFNKKLKEVIQEAKKIINLK